MRFQILDNDGKLLDVDDSSVDDILESMYGDDEKEKDLILPPEEVVRNFDKFFAYGGGVLHSKLRDENNRPVRVTKPAWYQSEFAKMKRAVMLKGNKLGVTMGESINDFRTRLLPEHAGFNVLLVGSNQLLANEHLLDLKKWVLSSPNLKKYLILRPEKRLRLREEKSKKMEMYIENPYDPGNSSRIIAIGFSEALAYSWKHIDRLHISDPGQISRVEQQQFFSGLFSRLTNTEGEIKIEGVAGNRAGYFWELCKKLFSEYLDDDYQDEEDIINPDRDEENQMEEMQVMSRHFERLYVTADDGLKAGVITQKWLDFMKGILPRSEYLRLYYCQFAKPEGGMGWKVKTGEHEPLGLQDLMD